MKTQNFLSALLVLFASFTIQAQTIDPASEWRVNFSQFEPNYYFNSYYKDFIDGVSTIDSIDYFNVFCSGYSTLNGGPPSYFSNVLDGYLREEGNKWYTYIISENRDALLFDFTLGVNDTVNSAFTWRDNEEPVIVTAVDSILVDGEYKKRMHLNFEEGSGAEYIIEGIGATSGLFGNMWFFEWASELVCFAKDGNSLWGTPTEECDLAVNINENQENTDPCTVFPNPAKDFTTLTIPSDLKNVTFKLIDLVGGIVYQKSFESPSTNKILLTTYHSGVYFAVIETNGFKQSVKLIIE